MAQKGINKVILIGNLGADPEMRYTPSGMAIANLRLATSESWKDKNTGEPQERTEWHRVSIFGKPGEIAGQYLKKGSKVYIEGQLRTRKWQAQDGSDRYSTEVVVSGPGASMQMLDSRAQHGQHGQAPQTQGNNAHGTAPPSAGDQQDPNDPGFDDDIPF